MKKSSKPKPAPTQPDYLPALRKIGRGVQFTFLREIRRVLACEESEAVKEFEMAVKAGKIVQDGETGGLKIYLAK